MRHCIYFYYHFSLRAALLVLLVPLAIIATDPIRAADAPPPPAPPRPFAVEILDDQTGRGVPLVELETVSHVRYWTDSAGLATIDDPALLGRRVFFSVRSHGYEFPADGFGSRGVALDLTPAGHATLKIKRRNLAERLYRLTGEGIYRDSVILGRPVPIRQPLLDAQVTGQDSTQAAVYRGKIYWFWGDTMRQSYPLGQYWTAAATSDLPGPNANPNPTPGSHDPGNPVDHGDATTPGNAATSGNAATARTAGRGPGLGLDPALGVNLDYFTDAAGFSKPAFAHDNADPIWLDALMTLPDAAGRENERLVAVASRMKNLGTCVGRRLVTFDDQTHQFKTLREIPLDAPLFPFGQAVRVTQDRAAYFYFPNPFPDIRVKADLTALQDLSEYESFTPLAAGCRVEAAHPDRAPLDRDAAGKLLWAWKHDTALLTPEAEKALLAAGRLKPDELWFRPLDVETHHPIRLSAGSVNWNAYRRKWVMIAAQVGGKTSYLGEIYYAEADHPEGPWPFARKILTHDRYSFYNPVHHPFFDQDGGRVIYFEGTYAATFSRETDPTPRYDYNPIMYRLDLSDPRLKFPAPATTPPAPPTRPASEERPQ